MAYSTGDEQIDVLLEIYAEVSDQLADYLAEMPFVEPQQRREIYLAILLLLANLREQTREWAEAALGEVYREADLRARQHLEDLGFGQLDELPIPEELPIVDVVDDLMADLEPAIESVQATASRFQAGRGVSQYIGLSAQHALAAGLLGGAAIASLRSRMRQRLRDGVVSIIGRNGQAYYYALDYYAAMVAQHKKFAAISQATVARCRLSGHDLVRVSPQRSRIGDYCDEYRGRVVSLSGRHPNYPPASSLPAGGAPFHPHCWHYMEVWSAGMEDPGPISDEFLELAAAQPGATPNDYQRLWREAKAG